MEHFTDGGETVSYHVKNVAGDGTLANSVSSVSQLDTLLWMNGVSVHAPPTVSFRPFTAYSALQ